MCSPSSLRKSASATLPCRPSGLPEAAAAALANLPARCAPCRCATSSEPARSTRRSEPYVSSPLNRLVALIATLSTVCARDDRSLRLCMRRVHVAGGWPSVAQPPSVRVRTWGRMRHARRRAQKAKGVRGVRTEDAFATRRECGPMHARHCGAGRAAHVPSPQRGGAAARQLLAGRARTPHLPPRASPHHPRAQLNGTPRRPHAHLVRPTVRKHEPIVIRLIMSSTSRTRTCAWW